MAEPVEGMDASPPEAREPDEGEKLVRAASPRRLLVRIALVIGVAAALGAAHYGVRRHRASRLAHDPPMDTLPAGSYRMGADDSAPEERPAHTVQVASFRLDTYEVTVGAYRLCVKARACSEPIVHEGCNWGRADREDHPVNCVDWLQAEAHCRWAGKRLPTEEEWEYAARGTLGRRFPWGDAPPGPALLNVCDRECKHMAERARGQLPPTMFEASDGWASTAPVGSYPAGNGPFGTADLAGNVWEWTSSAACPYAEPGCDSPRKTTRGGGWSNAYTANIESTTRAPIEPTAWSDAIGFRCAR
jgi:formylglycine-generating enzyme required for sulfatase activity